MTFWTREAAGLVGTGDGAPRGCLAAVAVAVVALARPGPLSSWPLLFYMTSYIFPSLLYMTSPTERNPPRKVHRDERNNRNVKNISRIF